MSEIPKRLEKAEKHFQKGKLDAALAEYLAVLDEDPAHETAGPAAADLCVTLGRTADAVRLLTTMLDRQFASGHTSQAQTTFRKLARLSAPSAARTLRFAQSLEKSNPKEALEAYQSAFRALKKAGKKRDALVALNGIVALDRTLENLEQQARLAAELGDRAQAVDCYLQCGRMAQEKGADTLSWFEKAYGQEPTNRVAALEYARALLADEQPNPKDVLAVIEPLAKTPDSTLEERAVYIQALLLANQVEEAAPLVWETYEHDPEKYGSVVELVSKLLDAGVEQKALELAQRLEEAEKKESRWREYVALIREVVETHQVGTGFLEYMVQVYNASNREHDYCATLIRLFDLYYVARNFIKAADCLDRAAEVDAYEPGHRQRLEMLRGKIESSRFNSIANRLGSVLGQDSVKEEKSNDESESTVLEDLILQAEIFLQYSMRSRAVERLQRINKLFPHEEEKNEKLRAAFVSAGYIPNYADQGKAAAAAVVNSGHGASVASQRPVVDDDAADKIARVTEITRNIYRQGSVKAVLFTGVNDIGRHWDASRCIAVLCSPGKPPSIALEYCAPGISQSDVNSIVKLVALLQPLALAHGPLILSPNKTSPMLGPLRKFVATMGIDSMIAMPLTEGEEHVGLLILAQSGIEREWRQTDQMVLKTIADQIVLAVTNARLRSLVKNLAVTEEKSGLLKRVSYIDVLLSEIKRAAQQNSTVSVMLLNFGKAGDLIRQIGESEARSMMQNIGQLLASHIRQNDLAVHYDATTIALVLADTNERNAFFVAEKLRRVMAATRVPGTDEPPAMASGIAEAVVNSKYDPVDIVTELINRAEAALEAARAAGKNEAKSLAPLMPEGSAAN